MITESEKERFLKEATDESKTITLRFYLSLAKEIILGRLYPFGCDDGQKVPEKYEATQIEIAAYLLNKRGAEGELTHSENGISRTYESADVPESLLKRIVPFCGTFGGGNS